MIGGGADRSMLIPLDAAGNRPSEQDGIDVRVVGCHRGNYSGLNVPNPQPNMEYTWMDNPQTRDGGYDQSFGNAIRIRKGAIVSTSDPDGVMGQLMADEMRPMQVDTAVTYNELVLVRIPVAAMRAERAALQEKNENRMSNGAEAGFMNRRSQVESQYGGRGPTRYCLQRHHSELHNDGRPEVIITPDSKAIPTEGL